MPKCVICRDQKPTDCPGCDPDYHVTEEMCRDPGEERYIPMEQRMPGDRDEYYPGCYEG